jgi:hypothetical protein
MTAFSFGSAARKNLAMNPDEPKSDKPLEAAWMVLDAANDLGDHTTVEVCRRVIDAGLNGKPADPSDLHVVLGYFR